MSIHPVTTGTGQRRYEVRWREGDRQRSRTFALKRDADAWDREVARRRQLGPLAVQQLTVKGPTLGDWIATRWSPEHAATLEQKTRDRYANSYEVHVEPWLGHLALQELSVGRLREWQADRLRAGASAHALVKARTLLSSVLRHAAESEAIQANPITLVRPPKSPHTTSVVPLAPRLVEALRTRVRPRDATIIALLAYSGIRPGELRSLRWGDIGNTLRVEQGTNPDGTAKPTKTKRGKRNVRLLEPLAEDLAAWRAERGGRGAALVFARPDGKAWTEDDWNNWRGRIWRPLCRELGLDPRPVPYDLRHSFASLLLAEGRSVHYVAEQLGHDAALTLSTYGHVIAEYADSPPIDATAEIRKARNGGAA